MCFMCPSRHTSKIVVHESVFFCAHVLGRGTAECIVVIVFEPHSPRQPRVPARDSALHQLDSNQPLMLQYGSPAGYSAFLESLAKFLDAHTASASAAPPHDPTTLMVTNGISQVRSGCAVVARWRGKAWGVACCSPSLLLPGTLSLARALRWLARCWPAPETSCWCKRQRIFCHLTCLETSS